MKVVVFPAAGPSPVEFLEADQVEVRDAYATEEAAPAPYFITVRANQEVFRYDSARLPEME